MSISYQIKLWKICNFKIVTKCSLQNSSENCDMSTIDECKTEHNRRQARSHMTTLVEVINLKSQSGHTDRVKRSDFSVSCTHLHMFEEKGDSAYLQLSRCYFSIFSRFQNGLVSAFGLKACVCAQMSVLK